MRQEEQRGGRAAVPTPFSQHEYGGLDIYKDGNRACEATQHPDQKPSCQSWIPSESRHKVHLVAQLLVEMMLVELV